ncbi:hypothetical protein LEP1GSC016_1355 [Leptospira borgpetersenii serovar Hardjo-bovis str. Sponselee]|uniref:Uncharacterized protein n=2 Tax=Leptospira borgpetersenii TaxID=174 RepID=M6C2S7_LEPBO|nr:hypothetical protein LEP1GSC016_1355 [Leptospira borgpetersenii serovar Hardjo-bovis str. Sponselee]EMO62677.1 hypothetical protein LEP1GSC133_1737 [Leptospira borgpetersenii serovar Pomona str. 200901868]
MNNYKSQSVLGIHYGNHSQGYELCSMIVKSSRIFSRRKENWEKVPS